MRAPGQSQTLLLLFPDADVDVRRAVVSTYSGWAHGGLDLRFTESALVDAMGDEDEEVRSLAADALQRLRMNLLLEPSDEDPGG